MFDDFLRHEEARLWRGDLAAVTVASHRKILNHVWRPDLGDVPFLGIRYSMLIGIADAYPCNKKTYDNAISALRRAFNFGYLDYPERGDRFFTGLRPSEEIALDVTDYDAAHGVLSVTKARVLGIDRDVTKDW